MIEYLATSIVVILMPGTGVLYTLASAVRDGWRGALLAALGCTLGIVPHIIASIVGLAALLHTSALAFQIVKYLGVVYLLYMAWGIMRDNGSLQVRGDESPDSMAKIIANGFLLNILNPKLSLFFLAFLPQFVPENAANPPFQMLALASAFMLLTFLVFVGYGASAVVARRSILAKSRATVWLRRCFAGAFAALAMRLALADR